MTKAKRRKKRSRKKNSKAQNFVRFAGLFAIIVGIFFIADSISVFPLSIADSGISGMVSYPTAMVFAGIILLLMGLVIWWASTTRKRWLDSYAGWPPVEKMTPKELKDWFN